MSGLDVEDNGKEEKKFAIISKVGDEPHVSLQPRSLVKFNVGGKFFETTHATLMNFPHSVLAQTCSTTWGQPAELLGGRIFIDRNGDRFQEILDFCRELEVPAYVLKNEAIALAVWKEARYYGLHELQSQIELHYGSCKHCGESQITLEDKEGKCRENKTVKHAILEESIFSVRRMGQADWVRAQIHRVFKGSISTRIVAFEVDQQNVRTQTMGVLRMRNTMPFGLDIQNIGKVIKCVKCDGGAKPCKLCFPKHEWTTKKPDGKKRKRKDETSQQNESLKKAKSNEDEK